MSRFGALGMALDAGTAISDTLLTNPYKDTLMSEVVKTLTPEQTEAMNRAAFSQMFASFGACAVGQNCQTLAEPGKPIERFSDKPAGKIDDAAFEERRKQSDAAIERARTQVGAAPMPQDFKMAADTKMSQDGFGARPDFRSSGAASSSGMSHRGYQVPQYASAGRGQPSAGPISSTTAGMLPF